MTDQPQGPPPLPGDTPPAPGYWKASDGNWYPPQPPTAAPPPPPPPPTGFSGYASAPTTQPGAPTTQPGAPTTEPGAPPTPPPMGYGANNPYGVYGAPPKSNGQATAALVLGIISIVLFWTFGFGIILGILAIVFGVLGRGRAREITAAGQSDGQSGRATAGLVTGVLGVVGGALFIVLLVAAADDLEWDQINTDPPDGECNPDRFLQDPDC